MRIDKEPLIKKLIGSRLKERIIRFLNSNITPISEREMAKILNVSHTAINKIMREMNEYYLVKAIKVGGSTIWEMNADSIAYDLVLDYLELDKSALQLVIDHLEYSMRNMLKHTGENIFEAYIIGSVAEGHARLNSDIDVIILCDSKTKITEDELLLNKMSEETIKKTGNELSVQIYTRSEIEKRPELHWVKDAIKKGIRVYP